MATDYSDALDKYSKMKSGEALHQDYLYVGAKGRFYKDLSYIKYSTADGYTEEQIMEMFAENGYGLYSASEIGEARQCTEEECADFLRKAQAKYDTETAKLSAEEKQLDMELTQINTEHEAVKTEYDSVKSLVSDNTDKSFNVFS